MTEPDFRRFILIGGACFLLTFSAVWWWTAYKPMYYLSLEYPVWIAKMQLAQSTTSGKVIILGDSRPEADLIPSRIAPTVLNLALGGSTPVECYYFAQELASRPKLPRAVVISFSPFQFCQDDWFWRHTVEVNFLNLREIDEVRAKSRALKDEKIFGPESPGDFDARLKSLLYTIKFPSYFAGSLWEARFYRRYDDNQKWYALILATQGQMYFGHEKNPKNPDFETKLTSFSPSRIDDYYFNETLALFASKNIPVYFLAMPHNAASDRLYFPGLRSAFVNYLNQYASRYTNFHVLGDPFPSWPSDLFGDYAHLNEQGAVQYSDQVVVLLQNARVYHGLFGAR